MVTVQEFLYFVPGLVIQSGQSENYNPAREKAVAGWKHYESYTIFF